MLKCSIELQLQGINRLVYPFEEHFDISHNYLFPLYNFGLLDY